MWFGACQAAVPGGKHDQDIVVVYATLSQLHFPQTKSCLGLWDRDFRAKSRLGAQVC